MMRFLKSALKKNKIDCLNVLENGLHGKLNQNSTFPENDRRSRLPLLKGKKFINVKD